MNMRKDSIASHYSGTLGVKYSRGRDQDLLNHLGYQLQKKFFLPFLQDDMHVLDVGCGNGSLAAAIRPHVASIEGLEINPYPRELAANEQGLKVYDGFGSLPETRSYDAIISNHVLEHVPDVVGTLRIIRGYLARDGVFVTVLPIDDFRSSENARWDVNDPNHHLHTWTPLLFGNTLAEAGFDPIELRILTHAWSPKFFFLGDNVVQSAVCYLLSIMKRRRQLLAVASVRASE